MIEFKTVSQCINSDYCRGYNDAVRIAKASEWELFDLITSAYFGKRYYFLEDNGTVYSKRSHCYLKSFDDAVAEFCDTIGLEDDACDEAD